MYAIDSDIEGQNRVTLRVSDPVRSQEFYQDLFGLIRRETVNGSAERVLLVPDGDADTALFFVERKPREDGQVWLSVEVASVSEVLDLYLLAIMMGAKAMLPRKRGRRWSTVVTDPDGNRISIWTSVHADSQGDLEAELQRPVRWEWRLSSRNDVLEDEFLRSGTRQSILHDGVPNVPGRMAAGQRVERRDAPEEKRGAIGARAGENATEGKE